MSSSSSNPEKETEKRVQKIPNRTKKIPRSIRFTAFSGNSPPCSFLILIYRIPKRKSTGAMGKS